MKNTNKHKKLNAGGSNGNSAAEKKESGKTKVKHKT